MSDATNQLLDNLNALAAGLFLLTAFGIVAMRQAKACLNLFIVQSLLLAASAALLGLRYGSGHLYGVALVNLISKPFIVPWLLRKTSPAEIYTRREIDQALNIPTALLIALALAIGAYFVGIPLANAVGPEFRGPNVPIGIAVLLLGAFTLTVRREALSLLIGLLVDGKRRVPRRHFDRARSRDAGRARHCHGRLGHRVHHGRAGPRRAETYRHHGRRRHWRV